MKLLLVNPNVTETVTARMADEARRAAAPETTVDAVTARFGAAYIENRVEAAIAAHAVLDCLAEHSATYNAAIISAFGDPGLAAARELLDIPVVGLAEAALLNAWPFGRRYSIVALTPRLGRWFEECAQEHGLAGRLAAVRCLDVPIPDIGRAKEQLGELIISLCNKTVAEDGAEIVILGGGPLAGLARERADAVPVPLLDGVSCAVSHAETLVRLGPRPATKGSFATPPAKSTKGLSRSLTQLLSGSTDLR